MGNFISACTFIAAPGGSSRTSKVCRVIFPSGEIQQFRDPVGAAELMLECPGFFVVDSRGLSLGRRIYALGADEELKFGNVYVMLPARRVNSIATAGDVATMLMGTRTAGRRISGGNDRRVSPEAEAEEAEAMEWEGERSPRLDESLLLIGGGELLPAMEYRHRLSVCRSRKPALETIKEEAVLSR
ncbi:hypothetical protein MLD38_005451 [Melastoma candidum]|uniref:Uncharacterized protein n=1 Tax=Melastoma candidum TaxID=119954 RepID=A0ACB9RK86_9MYRT|nr:hypothetical protein MLD38_005451 [Melastoma candidum]